MEIRNGNKEEIEKALSQINVKYEGNIEFKRLDPISRNAFRITLKVKNSKGLGARLGFPNYETSKQRHLINACWHVHGDFFEELFKINQNITIRANGNLITVRNGNWEDKNIGSIMNPLMYSDACECYNWPINRGFL